jgi:hypothetical protein
MSRSGTQFGPLCERIAAEELDPAQAAFRLLARWATDRPFWPRPPE